MNQFIKSNALISLIINLVINAIIPFLILWNVELVYLKEGSAILLPNILAPVIFSALMTTIITFFLMTKKRKSGEIDLPISPSAKWFFKAILEGIAIGLLLGIIAFVLLVLIQNNMNNIPIPVNTVLVISSIIGGITGFITSFIAANRALKIK